MFRPIICATKIKNVVYNDKLYAKELSKSKSINTLSRDYNSIINLYSIVFYNLLQGTGIMSSLNNKLISTK